MWVEVFGIILNSILSLIAIIVSVIAIKKQTQEQKLQNTIQLFDKRIQIYTYLTEIFGMSGVVRMHLHLPSIEQNVSFKQFKKGVEQNWINDEQLKILTTMTNMAGTMSTQATALFEKDLAKYIEETIDLFVDFVDVLVDFNCCDKPINKEGYNTFLKLYQHIKDNKKGEIINKINAYLNLTDIKRV